MTWAKTWEGTVETDWLDELDHVNFLTYQRIADLATLKIWRGAKAGSDFSKGLEFVMTETHVRYLRELRLGAPVEIVTALIAWDTKRFQVLHRIQSGGELTCTVETLNLCFDPMHRKVANFTPDISNYFDSWADPPDDAEPQLSISRRPRRS